MNKKNISIKIQNLNYSICFFTAFFVLLSNCKNNIEQNHEYIEVILEDAGLQTVPDKFPSYPGGINEVYKFIGENINCPEEVKEGLNGKILIGFVVTKNGNVNFTEKLLGNSLLSGKVVEVINKMDNWTPAEIKGKSIDFAYKIPITFNCGKNK